MDQQVVTLDGVQPGAQTLPLVGFDQVQQLFSMGYTDIQWTGVCGCQGIACCPPVLSGANGFCISGTSNHEGWSWKIADSPLPSETVDVPPLPAGAAADQFVAAFVASVNAWFDSKGSLFSKAKPDSSNSACFKIKHTPGFSFFVGPLGQPDCLVTRNPAGCAFNPLILDTRFAPATQSAPPSVPSLQPPWGVVLAVLSIASAVVCFRRTRRRQRSR